MPLNRRNTGDRARVTHAGADVQELTLYKRGDDQQQGTVRTVRLFTCYRDSITRSGQTLRRRLTVDGKTTWHLSKAELQRNGVNFISATDKFYDPVGGDWWTPYAEQTITEPVLSGTVDIECKMTDPS